MEFRNKYINKASKEAGIPYRKMKLIMSNARSENGISFSEFEKNAYYKLTREEMLEQHRLHEKRRIIKAKRIETIIHNTGWSHDEAKIAMESANKQRGISNSEYIKYELFFVQPDNQIEVLKRKKAEHEYDDMKNKINNQNGSKKSNKRNVFVERVAKKSGNSYKETRALMKNAKEIFGVSYSEFEKNNYYKLSMEEIGEKHIKREKQKQIKEKRIETIMLHTGCLYDEAKTALYNAKVERGISNSDFIKYELFLIDPNNQTEILARKKAEAKIRRDARNLNSIIIRDSYIDRVVNDSGWEKEYAIRMMEECEKRCGMSFEHYAAYQCWNMSHSFQETLFTKGHSDILREKYNTDKAALKVIMKKDLFCKHYGEFLGRNWMSNLDMTFDDFKDKFLKGGKIIYKPRTATGGKGIQVFEIDDINIEETFNTISSLQEGIIETFIVQHKEMNKLSLKSVNTIRAVTIRTNDKSAGIETEKVHILYMALRMGCGDTYVDNMHSGGMVAGLDKNTGVVLTDAMNFKHELYSVQPDTGEIIKGFRVPMFDDVLSLIKKAASKTYGYLGWDVAITVNGPVIIEANTNPGSDILQVPYLPEMKGMKYVVEEFL